MSFGQSGQSTVQWSGFNSLRNGYKMYWLGNSPVISLMDDRGEKIISWRWPVSPYMYPQYVCIGTEVPRQPLLTGEGSIPSDLIIVMLFLISSNVCLFLHVKEPEIKLEKWNPRNFSVMIPSSSLPSKWDLSGQIHLSQRVTSTFWRKILGAFWTNPHS